MNPVGELPRLSGSARRALLGCGLLAGLNAAALVVQAVMLADALAAVVTSAAVPRQELVVLTAAVLARVVLSWATESLAARAAAGAKEELRAAAIAHAMRLGPEWIGERGPAELTTMLTKGLDALDAYFTTYLPALVTAAVVPPLIGGWILLNDPTSAVLLAITLPLIPLFAVLVGHYTQQRTAATADATERLASQLRELLRALPLLISFNRAAAQVEAVRRVSERHRRATMRTLRVAFSSALVLELAATLSVALIAVGIGLRLVSGDLAGGLATGLVVLILAPECYLPLRAAGAAHHASEDGMEAVNRVATLLATPAPRFGETPIPAARGHHITVHDLSVTRRDRAVPHRLSYTARPGRVLDLGELPGLGPSGSGKSTVFAVLLGFRAPSSGTVTVDGRHLSTVSIQAWRRRVAWVPQRPAFAATTVVDELRLAVADRPEVTPERAELAAAAADAAAGALLDRPIARLSAGERHRVAIARALLRVRFGAGLLLLDEPTAQLDPATARHVMDAVRRVAAAGVTVILASHCSDQADASDEPVGRPPAAAAETGTDPAPGARLRELWRGRNLAGVVLGAATVGCGIALTATAAWLIARASQQPPILTLSVAVVAVRTFGLGRGVLRYVERLLTHDAAFRLATELRERLWRALVRAGPARLAAMRRTETVQRLADDTDTVRDLVPRVLHPPAIAAVVCAGVVALQSVVLPSAGVLTAVAIGVAALGGPVIALVVQRNAARRLAAGRRRLAAELLTLFETAGEALASGAEQGMRASLATADGALATQARRQALAAGAATGVITGATGMATVVVTSLAAGAVAVGELNPVLAPLLALVPLALVDVLAPLIGAATEMSTLRGAHARLRELARYPEAAGLPAGTRSSGDIDLCQVDASWESATEPTLRAVTLHVPAGTWAAVTGPSGAGKSTLFALLLGFLPADAGSRPALPARIAWCPQDPQLVSTTVRENLRIADPRADDEALRDALRLAGLPEWTERLDTLVGSDGGALSGGEATRLAVARTMVRAPQCDVVLLDEPTAHLDEPTAREVLARLRAALAARTVLHITHRASEAETADLIITVDRGSVRSAVTTTVA